MTVTEKALIAMLKDIGIIFYIIDAGLVLVPKKFSIAKTNYYYDKVKKDIEE